MDLALISKSWAGNVYHQFESICQDVDDFMSKETMKFVENQVQSVGTSVKRFYSNVVEEMEPPSKDGDQATTIGSEDKLSENQELVGDFREADASLPIGVETDALFSGTQDEDHKNSMPIMHDKELNTEDHKDNSGHDILIDSNLCIVEDPDSYESESQSYLTVCQGSLDSSACDVSHRTSGIDGTLCDISSEVESFDVTGALDVLPNLSIFEPNDISFSMDESIFVGGLSEKRDKDDLSEIQMSFPSETGIDGMHLDMETVDLSTEMKHDEPSVILHGNSVHAASHGKRNFRYYKKLIQDALTSRKRLSKEYEHLAVLYGDIESDLNHHYEPMYAPSSTNSSVHAVTTQSFHDMSETEWELV